MTDVNLINSFRNTILLILISILFVGLVLIFTVLGGFYPVIVYIFAGICGFLLFWFLVHIWMQSE